MEKYFFRYGEKIRRAGAIPFTPLPRGGGRLLYPPKFFCDYCHISTMLNRVFVEFFYVLIGMLQWKNIFFGTGKKIRRAGATPFTGGGGGLVRLKDAKLRITPWIQLQLVRLYVGCAA